MKNTLYKIGEVALLGTLLIAGFEVGKYVLRNSALVRDAEERGKLMDSIGNYQSISDRESFMKEHGATLNRDNELMRRNYGK